MGARIAALLALLLSVVAASAPATAVASAGLGSIPAPPIADILGIGGALKSVLVGGFEWTTEVAGKFVVNTLAGLVDLLIPDSWATQGLSVMQWVVAIPNYAAHVAGPGGGDYAFAGINDLRDLFVWIGIAMLPLTLTYASTRAIFGLGDNVAMPIVRTLAIGVVLISYTWLWAQVAAICNQITKAILGVATVAAGINKMFEFLVGGGALIGALPLIGLVVVGAAGAALLAMIFLKVLMILVGAIVYVTGPLMIGIAPTERGAAAARAWLTLALGLVVLPILWATVFAIAALLMNDSTGAGSVIGTSSDLGTLLGGLVLGLAAIAGFYLNLKLTKFAAALLGGQIAGMLALAGGRGSSASAGRGGGAPASARDALSSFGSKVGGAARGAGAALGGSGRAGAMLAGAGGGAGALARGGLLGAGGGLAKRGVGAAAASPVGQALGGTKAGALATRMARGGRSGWQNAAGASAPSAKTGGAGGRPAPTAPGVTPPAPIAPDGGTRPRSDARSSSGSQSPAGAATRDPGASPGTRPDAQRRGPRGPGAAATPQSAPRGNDAPTSGPGASGPRAGRGSSAEPSTAKPRGSRVPRPRRKKGR